MEHRTKGTDIVALRKIFKARGDAADFEASLPPDLRRLYRESLAFHWNPVTDQTALYRAASEVLYPGDPDGLMRLGRDMALHSYSTVYKILLRLPTTQFVIAQAAKLWSAYFDRGRAAVEEVSPKGAVFVLRDYPELPADMRQIVRGNITAAAETTGVKGVRVRHEDADARAWRWVIAWE